jgi:uncharacterized protein YndB with AHSA1/START domain
MTDEALRTEDLRLSERIRATPDQVFDFLVQPEQLVRWMGVEAKIDPTPGGSFWLNVTGNDIASGNYVVVERPHRVAFTWGWEGSTDVPPGSSTVSFTLTAEGEETVVELVHSGLPGGQNDEHLLGWTYFIDRLLRIALGEDLEAQDPGRDHGR